MWPEWKKVGVLYNIFLQESELNKFLRCRWEENIRIY